MKRVLLIITVVILFVLVLLGTTLALGYGDLLVRTLLGPPRENINRRIFENTQSYVFGKVQDLAKYKREYDSTGDLVARNAIRELIVQQFAQFDKAKIVDPDLRKFLVKMRGF